MVTAERFAIKEEKKMIIQIQEHTTTYITLTVDSRCKIYWITLGFNGDIAFCDNENHDETRGIRQNGEWECYPSDHEAAVVLEMFIYQPNLKGN